MRFIRKNFDPDRPIYIQIREVIEDQIIKKHLKEKEQAPSTNQLINLYKVNHITISKGVNQLVDEGILYKKRGIGMFVAPGARDKLIKQRKKSFVNDYIVTLVREANKLGFSEKDIISLIKEVKEREENED